MLPETWTLENYQLYLKDLLSRKEKNYKEFNQKTIFTKYEMIGIRLPAIRKMAKQISKTNIEDFLKYNTSTYYEEILIEGLVISYIKEEELFDKHFQNFIKKIDNWAVCDTFCNSIKIVQKNPTKYFELAKNLSIQKEEFIARTGLIMILSYFIEKNYLQEIFKILDTIESDKYYINMAESWLICELYISFPKETESYLKKNKLNKFTQNKAISKIKDSYRVTKEEKEYLNTLKRK